MRGILVVVFAICLAVTAATSQPGRVYLWSWSENTPTFSNQYITKTLNAQSAVNHVADVSKDFEVIVLLRPDANNKPSTFVQKSLQHAPSQQILSYVYPSQQEKLGEVMSKVLTSSTQRPLQQKNLMDLENTLAANPAMLEDGQVDIFEAPLTAEHDVVEFTLHSRVLLQKGQKVLFVSFEEAAEAHHQLPQGNYAEILSISSNIADGKFYKPEGAEYAIYYGSQYLYITPDIFTGLMTFLFVAFVILLGISCLGAIQGMSSFYDKLPTVGREA